MNQAMYWHTALFIHFAPKDDKAGSLTELARLCREFNVDLIAIGNGTASRETEALVAEMMGSEQRPETDPCFGV